MVNWPRACQHVYWPETLWPRAWHSKRCSGNEILIGPDGSGSHCCRGGPEPSRVQTQSEIMGKQKLQGNRRSHTVLKTAELTSHLIARENILKGTEKASAGEDGEKLESLCIAGGDVQWRGRCGRLCGGSENIKQNYYAIQRFHFQAWNHSEASKAGTQTGSCFPSILQVANEKNERHLWAEWRRFGRRRILTGAVDGPGHRKAGWAMHTRIRAPQGWPDGCWGVRGRTARRCNKFKGRDRCICTL